MEEESMIDEALGALGEQEAARILTEAAELDARIRERTEPLFKDFAAIVRDFR